MAEMKKQTVASADTIVEQLELSYTMSGSTNWKSPGKAFGNIYHAEFILTIWSMTLHPKCMANRKIHFIMLAGQYYL